MEIIVVDDGSIDGTDEAVRALLEGDANLAKVLKFHRFEENRGRLAARNVGMQLANHDWICWLDSDDEYVSSYLEIMNNAINKYPKARIFNFGAIVYDEQNLRSWSRDTFMPPVREDGGGHDVFKSGGIGTGSFIFKRELVGDVGLLPEARTPYGDDNSLPALSSAKWPELKELYGQTEDGQWKPFGNPWGDDWLYFFLLTRNNISQPLDVKPYIQHLRKG